MSRRQIVSIVLIAAFSGACRSQLTSGITCEAVRALRYDMTEEQVTKILGPPVPPKYSLIAPNPDDRVDPIVWNYTHYRDMDLFGGLRFRLEFNQSRLTSADMYATPIRDSSAFTAFESKATRLYWLDRDGPEERPAFSEYFNCR